MIPTSSALSRAIKRQAQTTELDDDGVVLVLGQKGLLIDFESGVSLLASRCEPRTIQPIAAGTNFTSTDLATCGVGTGAVVATSHRGITSCRAHQDATRHIEDPGLRSDGCRQVEKSFLMQFKPSQDARLRLNLIRHYGLSFIRDCNERRQSDVEAPL